MRGPRVLMRRVIKREATLSCGVWYIMSSLNWKGLRGLGLLKLLWNRPLSLIDFWESHFFRLYDKKSISRWPFFVMSCLLRWLKMSQKWSSDKHLSQVVGNEDVTLFMVFFYFFGWKVRNMNFEVWLVIHSSHECYQNKII